MTDTDGQDASPEGSTGSGDLLEVKAEQSADEAVAEPEPPGRKIPKDALVIGRRKVITITAGVAVVSLVAGMVAADRITSPGEAAARTRPPEAADITVPVEFRELRSDVVTRGDAVYAGASEVVVETAAMSEPAMVTGAIPAVGDEISAGQAILELAGRPVVALVGDIPVYRSLAPGMSGPDVAQLKAALDELGFDAGDPADDEYDQKVADAVAALFDRVGYEAPAPDDEATFTLESAEEAVDQARDALTDAQEAQSAPTTQNVVQPTGTQAQSGGDEDDGTGDPGGETGDGDEAGPGDDEGDPSGEEPPAGPSVADAQSNLNEAELELAAARLAAATPLPASEVVFLPNLPRRVDRVGAERGKVLTGTALEVSGADLVVEVTIPAGDASLVAEGMAVVLAVGDGSVDGTIVEIRDGSGGGGDSGEGDDGDGDDGDDGDGDGEGDDGEGDDGAGGNGSSVTAVIEPADLSVEQEEEIRGTNLRITIPVEATDGEVLAVPLAALTAGPGGESRVEVADGDGETRLVEVEVGLAAEGFAEVESVDDPLAEGDQVVVGR